MTFGEVLSDEIVTVMLSVSVSSPESVAEAVIVCVPTDKPEMVNVLPEPIEPSILEVQTRLLLRLPSSVSVADPLQVTEFPKI